jgi:hypothetical protein
MAKLKKGQTVWLVGGTSEPKEVTVTRVRANKAFVTDTNICFDAETLRGEYGGYRLVTDLQAHQAQVEADRLALKIRRTLEGFRNRLTLEQLRQIDKIINPD